MKLLSVSRPTMTTARYRDMQVFSAAVMSFTRGANDVSNAMGPFSAVYQIWRTGAIAEDVPVDTWILVVGACLLCRPAITLPAAQPPTEAHRLRHHVGGATECSSSSSSRKCQRCISLSHVWFFQVASASCWGSPSSLTRSSAASVSRCALFKKKL